MRRRLSAGHSSAVTSPWWHVHCHTTSQSLALRGVPPTLLGRCSRFSAGQRSGRLPSSVLGLPTCPCSSDHTVRLVKMHVWSRTPRARSSSTSTSCRQRGRARRTWANYTISCRTALADWRNSSEWPAIPPMTAFGPPAVGFKEVSGGLDDQGSTRRPDVRGGTAQEHARESR